MHVTDKKMLLSKFFLAVFFSNKIIKIKIYKNTVRQTTKHC